MKPFNFFRSIKDYFSLILITITPPYNFTLSLTNTLDQIIDLGINSVPLIVVISAFAGFVTAIQAVYQLTPEIPRYLIGASVEKVMLMEMCPVLVGLMVAGRGSSSIAAEIGAMKATEQIDALEVMAINPVRFLARPRIIAGAIALPMLTVISIAVSMGSALVLSSSILSVPISTFTYGVQSYFHPLDLLGGLTKSFLFGLLLASLGCFFGLKVATGGAREVAIAATRAVVYSSIMILVFDFIVATVFYI